MRFHERYFRTNPRFLCGQNATVQSTAYPTAKQQTPCKDSTNLYKCIRHVCHAHSLSTNSSMASTIRRSLKSRSNRRTPQKLRRWQLHAAASKPRKISQATAHGSAKTQDAPDANTIKAELRNQLRQAVQCTATHVKGQTAILKGPAASGEKDVNHSGLAHLRKIRHIWKSHDRARGPQNLPAHPTTTRSRINQLFR